MNFTPFYIAIDTLTEEQAHEVIYKSVKAGANIYDVPTGYPHPGCYTEVCDTGAYPYVGVSACNNTMFHDNHTYYGRSAIQITYDQLDAHLGLAQEAPTKTEPSHESLADKLRNTKIDLRKEDGTVDEELSLAFQEAVFECGGKWLSRQVIARHLDKVFLYIDEDLTIAHTDKTDTGFFQEHPHTQITFTYQRKLEWDVTEVPTTRPTARETIELNGITYDKAEFEAVMRSLTPIEVS